MLLETERLDAFYGDFQALFGIDLHVDEGETIALVGANGAGKTTFMNCLSGLISEKRGKVAFDGQDITAKPPEHIAGIGIALAPEGRALFRSLNVEENLKMGGYGRRPGYWNLERVFALFPLLRERRHQQPETLSGGQQGFVAIGRALMANPRLLLCDEISLGLAPIAVDAIYASFETIRQQGMSIILVEQDVRRASSMANRLYCLLEGRVTLTGRSDALSQQALASAYFGS